MHMRPSAKPAWDRLAEALEETVPDCHDDDRYVADHLDKGDKKIMGQICGACPLLDLCMDYALSDRPRGGWWPGVQLTPDSRKEQAA